MKHGRSKKTDLINSFPSTPRKPLLLNWIKIYRSTQSYFEESLPLLETDDNGIKLIKPKTSYGDASEKPKIDTVQVFNFLYVIAKIIEEILKENLHQEIFKAVLSSCENSYQKASPSTNNHELIPSPLKRDNEAANTINKDVVKLLLQTPGFYLVVQDLGVDEFSNLIGEDSYSIKSYMQIFALKVMMRETIHQLSAIPSSLESAIRSSLESRKERMGDAALSDAQIAVDLLADASRSDASRSDASTAAGALQP
jgi:hypothetical protein